MPSVLYRLLTTPIGRQWEEARLVNSTRAVIRGMTGSWTASWLKISDTFSLIQRSVSSYKHIKKNCNDSYSPWTAEFFKCYDKYRMNCIVIRVIPLGQQCLINVLTSMYCIVKRVIPLGQQSLVSIVPLDSSTCDIEECTCSFWRIFWLSGLWGEDLGSQRSSSSNRILTLWRDKRHTK